MPKEIHKNGEDMLYLVSCALHGKAPDNSRVSEMDLEAVYRYAKCHTLAAITYDALELMDKAYFGGLSENASAALLFQKWKEARDKALRKNMMLDAARNKLFTYLDEQGIWYMPLKGSMLKDLYPKQEMRQMADNDILFDATKQEQVKDYFVGEGYEVASYAQGNHDIYKKPPVYNFEMHTALFGKAHNEAWVAYYNDVKTRLLTEDGSGRCFFTDEDFYIYFVVHAFKHYDGGGTGIRSFVDCYVYLSRKKLDFAYIEGELEKLGILAFERTFRSVSQKVFGAGEPLAKLSAQEYEMLTISMYSGTYGTLEMSIGNSLHKMQGDTATIKRTTKFKYLLGRLFPPMSYYKDNYPFLYKTKVLIPFFIIYRMGRGFFAHGRIVRREAAAVWKADHSHKE